MEFQKFNSLGKFCGPMFAFVLLAGLMIPSAGFSETLYVKKSGTKLQAEPSAKSKVIKKLDQGTPVEVKEKPGKFYKVAAAGSEGYVFKFKLTSKKPAKKAAGGGLLDILGKNQQIAAKESSSSSSIRGLSPMSEDHAKKKGVSNESIRAVKQMEGFKVSADELETFLAKRKLGEYSE